MNTVTFGTHRSYDDLQILLTGKTIGTPAPKVEQIDLPGSDGVLDLTEFFDGTKYANRQLSFEFATKVHRSLFLQQFAMIQNLLHGKKMDIYLSDDPEWYYTGRVHVNEWKADKSVGRFTIDCDCEPFKHRESVQLVTMPGKNMLDLTNFEQGVLNAIVGKTWDELTVSTTKTRLRSIHPMPIKPDTVYTLSFPSDTFKMSIRQFNNKNVLVSSTGWLPTATTFRTLPDTQKLAVYISYVNEGTIVPANVSGVKLQLEEGSTASAFEAFGATVQTVTATFANTNRAAVPTIYVTSAMTVENGNFLADLSPGDNTLPDFAFFTGDNTLTFKGNGSALVKWTEGSL